MPDPTRHPAGPGPDPDPADPGRHERHDLTAVDATGELVVAAALTVHPVLGIVDGACTVRRDGHQRSVFASGRLPVDDWRPRVGPLAVEADAGLDTVRLRCEAADLGLAVDLVWRTTTPALAEPRRLVGPLPGRSGARLDETHVVRWGTWTGTVVVDDHASSFGPGALVGRHDRSSGRRPPGDGAPPGAPRLDLPAFAWWSATLGLADRTVHAAVGEHSDGERWFAHGVGVDAAGHVEVRPDVDLIVDRWAPGTRRPDRATLRLAGGPAEPTSITLDTRAWLPLRGIGVAHPEWAPGRWHDELAVGTESLAVDDLDPTEVSAVPARLVVTAVDDAGRPGIGVVDHLVLGAHAPSGLTGFTDPPGESC